MAVHYAGTALSGEMATSSPPARHSDKSRRREPGTNAYTTDASRPFSFQLQLSVRLFVYEVLPRGFPELFFFQAEDGIRDGLL